MTIILSFIKSFIVKYCTTLALEKIVIILLEALVKRTDSKVDDKIFNAIFNEIGDKNNI